MPFDDHGISRSQCRGGVSAGHRESQGKVARAENHHGAERMQHGADIGPRSGLAAGVSPVDAGHDPRTFFHHFREETELAAGARSFSLQSGLGQTRSPARRAPPAHPRRLQSWPRRCAGISLCHGPRSGCSVAKASCARLAARFTSSGFAAKKSGGRLSPVRGIRWPEKLARRCCRNGIR